MNKPSNPYTDFDALKIIEVAHKPVMLDADVAELFGVSTKQLNQAIKRNVEKFGDDFAWQMTSDQFNNLKSQIVTSSEKPSWGGRRTPPWVLTEHGVVMAATVLKSPRAVTASRVIVETFVKARKANALKLRGENLPVGVEVEALAEEGLTGGVLRSKLDAALGKVLDAIADPETGTTVREEARGVALEGINALREHLRKAGVQNESILAEIRKTLKEAEALDSQIVARQIENEHRKLALLAKQLRLVLAAQRYTESGSIDAFLSVLDELGAAA